MASANNNIEIMELLIKAGINLNLQNDAGNTPLRKLVFKLIYVIK